MGKSVFSQTFMRTEMVKISVLNRLFVGEMTILICINDAYAF